MLWFPSPPPPNNPVIPENDSVFEQNKAVLILLNFLVKECRHNPHAPTLTHILSFFSLWPHLFYNEVYKRIAFYRHLCVRIPQKLRIVGSMTVILVVFLLTAIFVKVDMAPLPFFSLTMIKIICINCEFLDTSFPYRLQTLLNYSIKA